MADQNGRNPVCYSVYPHEEDMSKSLTWVWHLVFSNMMAVLYFRITTVNLVCDRSKKVPVLDPVLEQPTGTYVCISNASTTGILYIW